MRKPKSLPDKRRRLTQREESAVALIALRMVVAEREWNPGDAPVVRMLDMMFRALEYQIAAKAFGAWLTRLGIQTLRRGGRKLVVVPVSFDEAEAALRKLTGAGHTLATAVKQPILEQVCRMVEAGFGVDRDTPAKAGNGSGPWPNASRISDDAAAQRGAIPASQHQDPPWLKPSDPATVVADLDEIDRILEIQKGGDATDKSASQDGLTVTRGPHAAPAEPRKPLNDFLDEEED